MGYTPPTLYVNKIAGGWSLTPPDVTTTDDLTIYANTADTTPLIKLEGNAGTIIKNTAASALAIYDGAVNVLNIAYVTADSHMAIVSKVDAKDLYLGTTGTGVLKFGTYTAGAATDSTGYITIKDAAGNTRKLMVQA